MGFLQDVFQAFMVGLVNGTIYGVIGLGIVLIFKAQRVINFAQAEIATVSAFALYFLLNNPSTADWPYPASAFLAVSLGVLLALLIERLVYQPLRDSPDVTVFVATAGVALLLIALALLIGGANILIVDPLWPAQEESFASRGAIFALISPQRMLVLAVLVVGSVLLALFFKTPRGKAILAMSAEPFAVRLAGINPNQMSLLIWGISGLLAGAAGAAYIGVPGAALTPGAFTTLALVPALTAVVIGGLTSLPGALVGGLMIGFVSELAVTFTPSTIPAPNLIASFIILLLTLLFRPQGLLARGT